MTVAWDRENEATLRGRGADGLPQFSFVWQALTDALGLLVSA